MHRFGINGSLVDGVLTVVDQRCIVVGLLNQLSQPIETALNDFFTCNASISGGTTRDDDAVRDRMTAVNS